MFCQRSNMKISGGIFLIGIYIPPSDECRQPRIGIDVLPQLEADFLT